MIGDFMYGTPTTLLFGKGVIKHLPEVMAKYGKNVLLTYGGGSVKKLGIYDEVYKLLKDFHIVELSGIEPNPNTIPPSSRGQSSAKRMRSTSSSPWAEAPFWTVRKPSPLARNIMARAGISSRGK